MKSILKFILLPSILLTLMESCKKEENKDYFLGGTSVELTASDTSLHLDFTNASKPSITLSWSNPNYKFTTGVSSQNVVYQLQIDTLGSNFTNPNMFLLSISSDLSKTFTVDELNSDLSNAMNLATGVMHTIQIRIVSTLAANEVPIYSNILQFMCTPYAPPPVITPPSTGTLFIVGSATPGGSAHGWDNPISLPPAAQQFTKVSSTLFTITIPLIGDGEYKFIAVNGSWNDQWSIKVVDDPNEINGGDFIFNGQNIKAPAASGTYKIEVDFQRGKFSVTPQ